MSGPRRASSAKVKKGSWRANLDAPVVTQKDLEKGIYTCVNRRIIPPNADVALAFTEQGKLPPLSVEAASFHRHEEQAERRELLTMQHGLCGPAVKLDLETPVIKTFPRTYAPAPPPPPPQPIGSPRKPSPGRAADRNVDSLIQELGDKARDPTRTYQELLDVYSLHEFIIRKGKTLANTPEFMSFQRSFRDGWDGIKAVVVALEELLTEYAIPLAYIDGKKVAVLGGKKQPHFTNDELLDCIANREEVQPLVNKPHRSQKLNAAARTIQSCLRMYLQRLRYLDLRYRQECTKVIQRAWACYRQHKSTRATLQSRRTEAEEAWHKVQAAFLKDWDVISTEPRIVVHLPSLSLTEAQTKSTPYLNCQQNAQMARLCDLADPNVNVLYIAPYPLERETMAYYSSLLATAGIHNVDGRVDVMHPENYKRVGAGASLTKSVLYSPVLLKRIAGYVQGKPAYIVPGVVGPEELTLAAKLGLPILGAEPSLYTAFASPAGAKRVFEAADVVTPVGTGDIHSEDELVSTLSKYLMQHPDVQRWIVKIEHEHRSRGLAYMDVRKLKSLEVIETTSSPQQLIEAEMALKQDLQQTLARRMKLVNPIAYPTWADFVTAMRRHGAALESAPADVIGSPTAHFFVPPGSGNVQVYSVQEQVVAAPYVMLGALFPQAAAPHRALRDAVHSIGDACRERSLVGYMSVDFVLHRKEGQLRLWAVDLDLGLTDSAVAHRLFSVVCHAGPLEDDTGRQLCSPYPGARLEPRCYAYSGLFYHPYLSSVRHTVFFGLCKQKGVSFDVQERTGTLFQLPDTLLKNCLGLLCIGRTPDEALSHLWSAVELIHQQLGPAALLEYARDESNFADVEAACKGLNRQRLGASASFSKGRTLPQKPAFVLNSVAKMASTV